MEKRKIKISIITVVYNNEAYIGEALDSLLSQSYLDVESIVIDGGSSDGTLSKIEPYRNRISKFLSESDRGMYDALNKGIRLATGDIVGILNSDDIFYDSNVLADVVRAFDDYAIDCLYGNLVYVDRQTATKVTRKWTSKSFKVGLFEKSWTPAHPTFFCRRELFEKYGNYRLDFKIAADVELMYRFLDRNHVQSFYLPRMMVKMRNAGMSNSGIQSTLTIIKEMKKAITENGGRFNLFKYLLFKFFKISQFIFK